MNVLIINAGSSSLKYQLMNPETGDVAAKGLCERIYIDGRLTHKVGDKKVVKDIPMPTHSEAIAAVLDILVDPVDGVIKSVDEIDAVGHRVLPDGAGIHHHHVGPFGTLDDGITALCQVAPQLFGVCLVLLAAIGLHIGRGCPALGLPIGRNFITEGKLRLQLLLVDDGGFCIHWAAPLKLDLDFEKVRAKMSLRRKFP